MLVVSAATALIASTFTTTAAQAAIPNSPKKSAQKQAVTPEKKPASAVPLKDRDTVLGKGWKTSADRAVTAVADSDGLHLMVADSRNGYSWKTAAVLSEPQLPADTWIGNQCVMDDHHAAVVYAPRTFANKPDLMMGGGFAAIVNLDDGSVTKLPFTASLAYFDPTCSPATHTAVFTALRDTKTRLITVNIKGATVADTTAKGEITSAVPTRDGVIAAAGNRLVHVDRKGRTAQLAATKHAPYGIRVSGDGTVSYIDRTGDTDANVQTYAHGRKTTVASGRLTAMNLRQGTDGTVYLTGSASHGKSFAASGIKQLNVSPDAELSTRGRLAVDPVVSPAVQAGVDNVANAGRDFTKTSTKEPAAEKTTGHTDHALTVTGTVAGTGRHTKQQTAEPDTTAGGTPSPALTGSSKPQLSTMSMLTTADDARAHDPVDTDAWCSVPRNDVKSQALQPTPNQVEWAVDMAVRNDLRSSYLTQGGWRSQTGLATIDPQGMFPDPPLNTGSGQRIPAQVELGILAQESNLWQAESGAVPGQMGSPLAAVDGYYGHQSGGSLADFWVIHWDKSDCGYGVGQVTDGMRKAGHEKPGEKSKDVTTQRAIALDYATNIAASLYILADKWNEVHQSGQTITVNNDDPSKPENWFTAVWNYNLGFNKKADAGTNGNWGLGWYNNPANPVYPASRLAFLNTDLDPLAAKDAAHPQNWPYEEKVMGWAAWSQDTGHSYATSGRQDWPGESGFSSAGFYPASWNGTAGTVIDPASGKYRRAHVSPPLDAFCNTKNNCNTANPPNCPTAACYAQYWWHESNVTWKSDCATSCGNEHIKYLTLVSEPGRGYRLQYGTPVCTGAPSGAQVVESVPAGTDTWGGCGTTTTDGSFQFTFYADPKATGPGLGQYDAKADLHQIGGGYGGHFWYTHTRNEDYLGGKTSGSMTIRGTWTPSRTLDLAEVYVYVPDTGAQAHQAHYEISGAVGGPYDRYVDQDGNNNKWVSLGAFKFDGTPSVSLSNYTPTGSADDDIAFGAVAFQPVQGTFVHRTLTAASVFDPNQELNSNWPVSELNTPIRAMKDLYNWATELSYGTDGGPLWDGSPSNVVTASGLTSWPKCTTEANKDECVGPQTYNAGEQWYQDIKAGGYTVKADGSVPTMSIPKWMGMSNVRPNPSASPDQAFKDPNSYKIKSDVSVTFVKDDTGHIISGSQSASYDVRVGNAHLPVFVTQLIKAISSDYGIATPDLTYTTPDALEYGRTYTADPLQDGDTPGQAYFPHFRGARLNSDNTCVDFRAVGGGVHGYRAMIGHTSVNDNVKAWVDKVDNSPDTNFSVRRVAEDIYSMFFKNSGDWNNNMWGTMIGNAPPIWHDIAAAFCADGSVKPTHKEGNGDADPSNGLVWQSYMPDLYVYIDGTMTDDLGRPSSTRVHAGDWKDFSNFPVTAPNGNAFGSCDASGRGSGGNPWGVDPPVPLFGDGPGNRPSKVLHCDDPGTEFLTNLTP
ncbi:Tat pathway signal protein [Streptomyces sp. NPDC051105]|uniref:golvesin C-terminal-like domain-containing protein n=1 Tax=Streptomyces sp. NPDC051105 TaxID=3154843 RepID=UPI0034343566